MILACSEVPVLTVTFFPFSQFPSPEAVLEGARYMVALQIAREPLVRQVLRQTFQERAKINISPTKKGKKVRKEALTLWVNSGKDLNNTQMFVLHLETSPMSVATFSRSYSSVLARLLERPAQQHAVFLVSTFHQT